MQDIYNPLKEYNNVFRDKFRKVCEDTFSELVKASSIDIAANRELCGEIDALTEQSSNAGSKINWFITLCVVLWLAVAASVFGAITIKTYDYLYFAMIAGGVAALLVALFYVHPKISELRGIKKQLDEEVEEKKQKALTQMKPLNDLYDWDVFSRMMTQTMPKLEFDPFFTTKRLADLKRTYGWNDSFNRGRSILFSHSGLINGNPFVICRTRTMELGSKTYYGEKTIHWTTQERGSDGKYHTVHHSQTLTASVTKPFPEFPENTWLIYGNTAAPDLVFNRTKNKYNSKLTREITKMKLERKSRDMKSDFAMSTNTDFEVLFTTTDRNNNQQYFLLFTPLAQESMIDLLTDSSKIGYGDDFDFHKNKKINTIIADHMQGLNLDMDPRQFHHYDFEKAKEKFIESNAEYFRAIYFCLAPLLCVPLYQQMRPLSDIYGREMPEESSFWEHEALANFWGEGYFEHKKCETHSILKTSATRSQGGNVEVKVTARGYYSVSHWAYISTLGGDGRYHKVPVEYKEYYPIEGNGLMLLREDTSDNDKNLDPKARQKYIKQQLRNIGTSGQYRRHIASTVGYRVLRSL
ncbi:MAG: hypothetical protein HUJ98_08445 [Bacteroidaceae bacterium]|nr:hypothetical protein [Bacteroidaceae bacterium]